MMARVFINDKVVEIAEGERLNAIEAAARAGITIPRYCWHPALSVVGSCRMCLVETGTRDPATGLVSMMPKLFPACNTIVRDHMVVVTDSEKVAQARAMVEESLLLRHPIDCPICDKAGECVLQDYHFQYGRPERRADVQPFTSRRRDLGEAITLFVDRCVLCSRCVRFAREISGSGELMMVHRGAHEEIDVFPGVPLNNKLSGNVVDLCPVGALGDKDFLYRRRVWFLKRHAGVCTGCATGCSIWIEEDQDRVQRIKPRENPTVNGPWICNDGRYDYPHVHDPRRIERPVRREGARWVSLDWHSLVGEIHERLYTSGRPAVVLSPFLTVEEAYLLATYVRGLSPEAILTVGPVPAVGDDERFPGRFTIAAEKCPNRRGVEEVAAGLRGPALPFAELVAQARQGNIGGLWVTGGYKTPWIDDATAASLARAKVLIVQDLFPSPLSDRAAFVLPATAYPEREGSYVNRYDHLQSFMPAIRSPRGGRSEGSLYWELLGRAGLYRARAVLSELAELIVYFHVARDPIPEIGVNLKSNLLAGGRFADEV